MSLADAMPPTWSILGLYGPQARYLPPRRTTIVDNITYQVAAFPATITPTPFAPTYTTATGINVADRFEQACRYIVTRSASARACNDYFRGLGRSAGRPPEQQYTLTDLLGWNVLFYFWRPIARSGPVPTSGTFHGATAAVIGETPSTRFAEIAIWQYAFDSPMTLAATIVHELAHIAGAPGATAAERSQGRALRRADPATYSRLIAAEGALRPCLFRQMFDPDAIGVLHDIEEADQAQRRVIT